MFARIVELNSLAMLFKEFSRRKQLEHLAELLVAAFKLGESLVIDLGNWPMGCCYQGVRQRYVL